MKMQKSVTFVKKYLKYLKKKKIVELEIIVITQENIEMQRIAKVI